MENETLPNNPEQQVNTEENREREKQEKRKWLERLFQVSAVILLVFGLITVFAIKSSVDSWSNTGFILTIVLIVIISVFLFFVFKVQAWRDTTQKLKDQLSSKLPPTITIEQARFLAQQLVMTPAYSDMIPYPEMEKIVSVGKNPTSKIFHYQAKGIYAPHNWYDVVINLHEPFKLRSILVNKQPSQVTKVLNGLAKVGNEEPDMETTESYNPMTGAEQRTTRTRYKRLADYGGKKEKDL